MTNIVELKRIDLKSGQITKPRWSPAGQFLAIPTEAGSVGIFDLKNNEIVRTIGSHSAAVTAVDWNREADFIMTGSLDRSIGVWQVRNGRRTAVIISGHNEPLHSVEWTDEGAYAMTCSSDRIRALDGFCLEAGWTKEMEDGLNKFGRFTAASCSFNTTLLLALAPENGSLLVLAELVTAGIVDRVPMKQPARCMAWAPTKEFLAVAAGDSIVVFRCNHDGFNGSPRELPVNDSAVQALAFSNDGSLLVSRDAHGLKIWNVQEQKLIAALEERGVSNSGLAFHPNLPILAMASTDGTAIRILTVE